MIAKRHHIAPRQTALARANRRPLTPPEARLWRHLRDRQLGGLKFRRQQVLGPYIADFCCFEARLVIELDGDSHIEQVAYDERRTAWLRGEGFRVLRFTNKDVFDNLEGVLEAIRMACRDRPPHPSPLPRGEREPVATARPRLRDP